MSKNTTDQKFEYVTKGGVWVERGHRDVPYKDAVADYTAQLDEKRGAIFSSNYEMPGRYTRWDTAIMNPPLGVSAKGRSMVIEAYNARGEALLEMLVPALNNHEAIASIEADVSKCMIQVKKPEGIVTEEMRSRIPTVFSVLRSIVDLFKSNQDENIGLYGAFGYDLAFQFEAIEYKKQRDASQRDLMLYLPDEILVVDHYSAKAWIHRYEFSLDEVSTKGLERKEVSARFQYSDKVPPRSDHEVGEYSRLVKKAKAHFERGDLFEVVPGQMFYERCDVPPSEISKRLKASNPSPYSFFINLGEQEYLVGASPEMFIRVSGRRIETCPISGTIKRGEDPIADSEQILKLLNSKKDESELTMCSDVDRNDKSRVCDAGSVRVIGRRQIEMYSRLIHTVDHIEGRLRQDMDAFDGFLSHAWAVTVTGAPKLWAMRFIEQEEKSARAWYGGAIGMMHFNGDMNTGLTLRTIRIKDGIAEVRAGATLLHDSIPEDEEAETELKASALIAAIRGEKSPNSESAGRLGYKVGKGKKILLVDHEDSFVHTLANYFRQTGAEVVTLRTPINEDQLKEVSPDLVVLSPGPGSPSDFNCENTIKLARAHDLPIFGVCLGLQAIVEAYGGKLAQLKLPMHGKPSRITIKNAGTVFSGLDERLTIGRYHSLYADMEHLSDDFTVTAETEDGIIMGIEHKSEPIMAVQFHPESIMSLGHDAGMRMLENVVASLAK
jgi:anthranilate synthase